MAGGGNAEVVPEAVTGVVPGGAPMPVTYQLTRPNPLTGAVKDVPDAGTESIVGVKQGHEQTTLVTTMAVSSPSSAYALTGSAVEVTFLTTGPAGVAGPV